MVKRSSSKRAYKKRGTVRKSRVIRRRKTTQSRRKTLRGGKFGDKLKGFAGTAVDFASGAVHNVKGRLGIGPSGKDELFASASASPAMQSGPSPQDSAAKERADAATAAAATKRAAADAAAEDLKSKQAAVDLQQSKLNGMNADATKTGWAASNGEAADTFKKQQDYLREKRNKLTAAKTAAAEAEAEAVAAEAEAAAAAAY